MGSSVARPPQQLSQSPRRPDRGAGQRAGPEHVPLPEGQESSSLAGAGWGLGPGEAASRGAEGTASPACVSVFSLGAWDGQR